MAYIMRIEVHLKSGYFTSVMDARKAAKMFMVEMGYKPVCSFGAYYKGGSRRCFVELEVDAEQRAQICRGICNDTYYMSIVSAYQDVMSGTQQSKFDQYYHEKEGWPQTMESPFCRDAEKTLYRDAYSDKISYEQLIGSDEDEDA
jgi:hypothetical protein